MNTTAYACTQQHFKINTNEFKKNKQTPCLYISM